MVFRLLAICFCLFLVQCALIESVPLTDEVLIENYPTANLIKSECDALHPIEFISLICQQQEQYPLKLTKKLCSNSIHSYKTQEQQSPREKRVGWTISV